jgi:hypothetical protein
MAERLRACLLLFALLPFPATAQPLVAVIIDDLGERAASHAAVLTLPRAVTLAILPHRAHSASLAQAARERGHEVLLHLPMEALGGERLGPGGLTSALDKRAFRARLHGALASVPGAVGVNNHMGSRLTGEVRPMLWLMAALAGDGLVFIDSRTTADTVAYLAARAAGLPSTERDVFLDNVLDPVSVRTALAELVAHARRHGSALGIAHPHPGSLAVLAEALPRLEAEGVRLVGVRELIAHRAGTGYVHRAVADRVSQR